MIKNYETYLNRKEEIRKKLMSIELPVGSETRICWKVAEEFKISGTSVKNYLEGRIADGYLAEAILKEFKKLKIAK